MEMELNEALDKLKTAGATLLKEGGAYESFVPWLSVGYKKAVEEIKKFFEDEGYEPQYMNGAIKESFPQIFKMFEEGKRADELGEFLVQIYHDF